ncbi:MAG: GNAT family N-acetyltransferase [Bacillota bacterium]|nr:GNAT family N-acetyltransferase [Bacillota bacterium]
MQHVTFREITEDNWIQASQIDHSEEQSDFVSDGLEILALAYVNRDKNARCYAIYADGEMVGLMLVEELVEEPSCYHLHEFLIDQKHQHKGYGSLAVEMLLGALGRERKFPRVELCVHKDNENAIALYEKAGFVKSTYIDEACPWNLIYVYTFPDKPEG